MVHLSRKKEDMASNGLEHSMLNDSLEFSEWRATASVAPESRNGGTDYSAFSEKGSLYLGLFSHYVVNMLQDKSSWKNRASGIGEIQSTISSVQDSSTLEANLPMIVKLVTIPLGDANFKVAQMGLELVGCLVLKVGRSLTPYLPLLVPGILAKMGSNKYAIRQAGMKVLMQLMHCCKLQHVLSEITNCGLQHKNSRVRGESINVVIAALLTFPKTELPLLPLVKEIAPVLGDEKQKVRQASLEAIALLSHLIDRADLKEVVTTVANAEIVRGRPETREDGGVSMMDAFHTRLSRQVYPQLNSDGLVEHAIPVANAKALHSYTGADVDWILASKGSKVSGASGSNAVASVTQGAVPTALKKPSLMQANGSSTSGTAVFRPYRSAGKRLPWEMEAVEEATTTSTAATSNMMNGHATFKPQDPPPLTLAPRMSLTSSPKHVTGERGVGLPPYESTTSRKTGGSYADIYLTKLQRGTAASVATNPVQVPGYSRKGSLRSTNESTLFVQRAPLPPHMNPAAIPPPITAKRHCSLPEGLLPPSSIGEGLATEGHQLPLMYDPHADGMGPGMSVSWPRSRVGVPVEVLRGSQQISANASAVVGGVHGSVRTNMSRPLSKPRVRNPLTSLKPQHQLSPQHQHSPQGGSPTQTEREFLASSTTAGWGENWEEEELYQAIPDDTTLLDSSLSSSLTSLCATARDTATARARETDKLKHIRKQAASRKAQLLSAECSTSNSPELSGTPPLRHPSWEHGCNRQEEGPLVGEERERIQGLPPTLPKKQGKEKSASQSNQSQFHAGRKWNSNGSMNLPPTRQSLELIDLNRTYVIKEDVTVTATPTTSTYTSSKKLAQGGTLSKLKSVRRSTPLQSQGDEPNEPLSREISLEGHSLERGGVTDGQPKKKPRKLSEPMRGNAPPKPRTSRSNSLAVEGQQRRPSIERGGTNMIDMEVSGIGSGRRTEETTDTHGHQTTSLSQATKESIARKKQKQLEDEEPGLESHSATYPISKPPIHPQPTDLTASAPFHHVRNKQKRRSSSNLHNHHQTESGYGVAGDEALRDRQCVRNSLTIETDSYGSTTGGSPNVSQLEELNPFANPEHGLREAMQNLSSDDWSAKCEGMLGVRRLAMFHADVLLPQLHSVVMAVQQEVKNLRSAVARGAIACFGDLFTIMGKAMEQDLDSVVRILLHKGGESNAFIREDVEKALTEMVNGVSPGRSLTALISGGLAHRNIHVRNTTSQFIYIVMELYGPGRLLHSGKEVERALPAIVQLVGDSAPEARYYARKSLDQLWPQPEFDRVASRVLSSQLLSKANQTIENLKAKGVGDPPSETQSSKRHVSGSNRHSTGGLVRVSIQGNGSNSASHKASSSFNHTPSSNGHSTAANFTSKKTPKKQHNGVGVESLGQGGMGAESIPLPEGLVDRLKASNWSERFEAVSDLENYVNVYPTALAPHLHKVFDAFSPRLTDRNSKVNLHALEAFSNIVPLLGNMLVPIVNNVVTALVPNLASRNPTIHSTAMTVLDLLSQCIDPAYLVQSVATNGQYGNARVQPIMIRKLAELTSWVYDQKPQLISRQVLPVMWHLLTAKTPATGEAKAATLALCETLYICMGHSLLDSASNLSPEHQKKLKELVDSLDR